MLAMTSRGIASCAQGALGLYPNIVREHLKLSLDHRLLFGISFGYEDPKVAANLARVGRADLSQAVHFHR
jgi:nitroreductase